jgi:hypothetical protein
MLFSNQPDMLGIEKPLVWNYIYNLANKESIMKKKDDYDLAGIAFVGFLMLGIAGGLLTGRVDVGVMAGLGLGFLAMVVVKMKS